MGTPSEAWIFFWDLMVLVPHGRKASRGWGGVGEGTVSCPGGSHALWVRCLTSPRSVLVGAKTLVRILLNKVDDFNSLLQCRMSEDIPTERHFLSTLNVEAI